MNDRKWERYGALGGVVGAILLLVAGAIVGSRPSSDDPASEFVKFFTDGDTTIPLSAFLSGLGVLAILWWFGSLWRAMRRAEGGEPRLAVVALGGLVFGGAMFSAASAIVSATAMEIESVGEGAKYFFTLSAVFLGLAAFGNAALVGGVSALAFRTKFLPAWIAWTGGVLTVGWLVAGISSATRNDALDAVGFVAFLLWLVWIIVVSVELYRKDQPATASY
jgi:tellurite resistance protein TehA-like permease